MFRIYQVELSAHCNMQCAYCPHPTMRRSKGFMNAEVLAACIRHATVVGDDLLVLHHFGEPLLHPHLEERLGQLAKAGMRAQLSTNALIIDKAWPILVRADLPITVMIAVHQWVAGEGVDAHAATVARLRERATGTNITIVPAYNVRQAGFVFHNWTHGERKPWPVNRCAFLRQNLAVVLWNGDLATCCCDHEGATVNGNILTLDAERRSTAWSACPTCDVGRLMQDEVW